MKWAKIGWCCYLVTGMQHAAPQQTQAVKMREQKLSISNHLLFGVSDNALSLVIWTLPAAFYASLPSHNTHLNV